MNLDIHHKRNDPSWCTSYFLVQKCFPPLYFAVMGNHQLLVKFLLKQKGLDTTPTGVSYDH